MRYHRAEKTDHGKWWSGLQTVVMTRPFHQFCLIALLYQEKLRLCGSKYRPIFKFPRWGISWLYRVAQGFVLHYWTPLQNQPYHSVFTPPWVSVLIVVSQSCRWISKYQMFCGVMIWRTPLVLSYSSHQHLQCTLLEMKLVRAWRP